MPRAIVLAGGYGKRFARRSEEGAPRPAPVDTLPKALAPLGGVPVLEIMLRQLRDAGIDHVTLCLFWKAGEIRFHFGDGSQFGLELEYSAPDRKLGSAGPLAVVDNGGEPNLVLNCDLLTSLDFGDVLNAHLDRRPAATVVAVGREFELPFGVLELSADGRHVRGHVEKPRSAHVISAGVYVLEPDVWRHLEPEVELEMPALLQALFDEDRPVEAYLLGEDETWIDIGVYESYLAADREFRRRPERYLRGASDMEALARVSGATEQP
jgi:NDP-sugar pyrophosphorylase family protein